MVLDCAYLRYYIHIDWPKKDFSLNLNFTVLILILVEAYGDIVKACKYYYCATFFVYESIWILSNFTMFYVMINLWNTENGRAFPILPFEIKNFAPFLYYLSIGYLYYSHWIKNTLVHISICRYKIFSVSIFKEKLKHCLFNVSLLPGKTKASSIWHQTWKNFSMGSFYRISLRRTIFWIANAYITYILWVW